MFPKLGFGTWQFGGRSEPYPNNDDESDVCAIQNAIQLGLTHIDTAESYANGKTEELVGIAIKKFHRPELFITTKVRDIKLGYDDIMKNCELSLKRLGVDYLDLYYIHKPNLDIQASQTAKAFNRLLSEGLIKNIGICNAKIETIENYQKYLDAKFFASQNHYNLIVREPVKKGLVDYCANKKIHFIAWRPIQLPVPELGISSLTKRGEYLLLDSIADKYHKTNAQIAVRWLTQQNNVSTIFKSANIQHIKEILDTENFTISDEDWQKLELDFPFQRNVGFTSGGDMPLI